MRKSKSHRKTNRQRSTNRNKKNRPFPFAFLIIIGAVLALLFMLPRPKYRNEQIKQARVSEASYPKPPVVRQSETYGKISPFIPEKKEIITTEPKKEETISVQAPKEKAEAKISVALPKKKSVVVNSNPGPQQKEKPEIKSERPELKLAKNSLIKDLKTQDTLPRNLAPKKSNISPRPRKNENIQVAKLPIEILPRIFRPKIKAKIAIVLDDWGYSFEYFELARNIKQPLTLAILPGLSYSQRIAKEAKKRGFELMLHLPMEPFPREDLALERDTITTDMDDLTIRDILSKQLDRVTYIRGVNNHMGSKATEDARVMRVVFEELKKRRLYFLDSFTSNSVCARLAKETKIRFARRDIFLDNENDPEYIKSQIEKLKEEAASRGYAIAIGHARRTTLEVLKEVMPKLEKEGFKFVVVSELAR